MGLICFYVPTYYIVIYLNILDKLKKKYLLNFKTNNICVHRSL